MEKTLRFGCAVLIMSAALVGCGNLMERINDQDVLADEHAPSLAREPCDVRLGAPHGPESSSGVAVVCPAH